MNELRGRAQKPDEDLRILEAGEFIAFTAGYSEPDANALISARPPERALATLPAFLNATTHALAPNAAGGNAPSASPFVTFYANAQAAAAAMAAANKNNPNFTRFIEVSGPDGLHRWLITASFDGPNWASSSVIDAPAPRRGLLKLFEGRPVEPAVLKQIPASAGSAQIFRFDFAALAGEIRNIVASISPEEGAANFDRAMGAGQMYLGANPIDDILAPLGDTWIVYTDEALAGNGTFAVFAAAAARASCHARYSRAT
jgi:hypothetical protein